MRKVTYIGESHIERLLEETPYSVVCFHSDDPDTKETVKLMREVCRENPNNRLALLEIDVSRLSPEFVQRHDLWSLPVVVFFRNQREQSRLSSNCSKSQILHGIATLLKVPKLGT